MPPVCFRPSCQELFDVALPDGRTPLHLAASADFANVISELLKQGANAFHTDLLGKFPIYGVAKTDQVTLIRSCWSQSLRSWGSCLTSIWKIPRNV